MKQTIATINRRPVPVEYDAEFHFTDGQSFRRYCAAITDILTAADRAGDENYRGVCTRYIHDALGDKADRTMTLTALKWIGARPAGLIPERWRLDHAPVRSVPKREWNGAGGINLKDTRSAGYVG